MNAKLIHLSWLWVLLAFSGAALAAPPLGLPPVPIPKDNPQSDIKIILGDKLFHDTRFSSTGDVSCSTCHDRKKAFTDSPLQVSEGINKLKGTRNAPTVVNAAYMKSMFWDGREPDLEGQSAGPFINPVEMGLINHEPILKIVRSDNEYKKLFKQAFKVSANKISMDHVKKAIAAFERTIISGNSAFDRYLYGGDKSAMSESAIRGLEVYLGQGRCVSCHTISQTHALFTDSRFHNLGVGFVRIENDVKELAVAFSKSKQTATQIDIAVLGNQNISELGRFVVSDEWRDMGAFKTPTLRNVAVTAPYMHDGSLKTLEDVVDFYNNGGRVKSDDPINGFQSGGIRPLELSSQQKDDLVSFMEALTSPEHAQ
ncbi:MAG: cytochrome-c peroxidase [Gammaproteobacteria bacterium]|nr:cytochrome-c peroxidase [Gammaproteobacteria bacterium]